MYVCMYNGSDNYVYSTTTKYNKLLIKYVYAHVNEIQNKLNKKLLMYLVKGVTPH